MVLPMLAQSLRSNDAPSDGPFGKVVGQPDPDPRPTPVPSASVLFVIGGARPQPIPCVSSDAENTGTPSRGTPSCRFEPFSAAVIRPSKSLSRTSSGSDLREVARERRGQALQAMGAASCRCR